MAEQTLVDVPTFSLLGPWAAKGACRTCDPGINFFPERGDDTRPAKKVCRGCPGRDACLADALTDPERDGIWGGTSQKQREKILRDRQKPTLATLLESAGTRSAMSSHVRQVLAADVPDGMARCTHCFDLKPLEDMTPAARRGGLRWCRACKRAWDHDQYLKRQGRR